MEATLVLKAVLVVLVLILEALSVLALEAVLVVGLEVGVGFTLLAVVVVVVAGVGPVLEAMLVVGRS